MKKIKRIKTKCYFGSHPLYDTMHAICNPQNEDSGEFYVYNATIFNMDSYTENFYDDKGQLTESVYARGLNGPKAYWTIERKIYKDGKIVSDSDDTRRECTYDENGKIIEYKSFFDDGRVLSHQKLEYNERGLVCRREELDGSQKGEYSTMEYDDNGRKILECQYIEGGLLSWRHLYYYDDKGYLARSEQEFYGDDFEGVQDTPRYTLISVFTREFDEEGNCVLEFLKCEDGMQPDELTINEIVYFG